MYMIWSTKNKPFRDCSLWYRGCYAIGWAIEGCPGKRILDNPHIDRCIYAHIVFYCYILIYIAIWYWHHGHSMALCLSHFVCVAALPLAGPFFAVLVSDQRIISLMGSYWSSKRSRGGSVRSSFRPSESTLKRESTLFYPQLWVNN